MATKRTVSRTPKSESGVIDIELTPEQREQIKRRSKGGLHIAVLRLRPELNLRLRELTGALGVDPKLLQGIANSGGQYWV